MYSEKSVAGIETANCSTQQGSLPGACASLAFPYIPMQGKNPKQYDRREALQQGTLFPGLDLPFHRELKSRFPAVNSALSELMALDFAVDELGLYLTTHADDKEALELYKAFEEYIVFHPKFVTWMEAEGYDPAKRYTQEEIDALVEKSPYYKATSNDVDWLMKVKMQGRIQKWVDHSISVTINLPNDVALFEKSYFPRPHNRMQTENSFFFY